MKELKWSPDPKACPHSAYFTLYEYTTTSDQLPRVRRSAALNRRPVAFVTQCPDGWHYHAICNEPSKSPVRRRDATLRFVESLVRMEGL
jgi:hypothetical protein